MTTHLIPILRYKDAPAAIQFLTEAFGFEQRVVVPGQEPGSVVHARLTLGRSMLMLATHNKHGKFDETMKLPHEAGGCTQALFVVVDDADAHCARAAASGAKITMPVEDWANGGRGYTCEDPEGHLWSFGTFDPW
jgi:uncharacterized glyoxalase superfamily protein PhnB